MAKTKKPAEWDDMLQGNDGVWKKKGSPEYPPTFPGQTTVSSRTVLMAHREGVGCICPVCDKIARFDTRRVTQTMGRFLVRLYKFHKKNPQYSWAFMRRLYAEDVNFYSTRRGDFAALRKLGLIAMRATEEKAKGNGGYWQLTKKGKRVVENKAQFATKFTTYNKELVEDKPLSEPVFIRDWLGASRYDSLMSKDFEQILHEAKIRADKKRAKEAKEPMGV